MMIENYLSLFMIIIGAVGLVAGAYLTIRSSNIKTNLDQQKELIGTLTGQRDAYKAEVDKLTYDMKEASSQVSLLTGENKTLREIATQTPEIIELTKQVTHNSTAMSRVATKIANLTASIEKHFEVKTGK